MIVYVDGSYVPEEKATVSVFDHGLLYGDGVFEGIRAYNGRVFKLREHLIRLYNSAKSIMLDIPLTIDQMEQVVLETVRRNNLGDAYIRLVVTRGKGDLGLDPRKCPKPTVIVIASSITLFPEELYEKGIQVMTVSVRRTGVDALNPGVKSLNYLNNILAKIQANMAGFNEVLMLNSEGYVCEGTGDNVFIVKNGALLTPPPYQGILEGITRATIMDIARSKGIPVMERPITLHDLFISDEAFLTGTAAEVIPVIKVDGRPVGDGKPGPITKDLIKAFSEYARSTGTPVYPDVE